MHLYGSMSTVYVFIIYMCLDVFYTCCMCLSVSICVYTYI